MIVVDSRDPQSIASRSFRLLRTSPRALPTSTSRAHVADHQIFPITQVAFGAPSKAMKASFVRPKAVRKGVVAMSAATDEIIEKMKTLTVSTQTLYRPNVGVPSG